jgi:hypothetical protein
MAQPVHTDPSTAGGGQPFEPANPVEAKMAEALARGDEEAFLRLLVGAELVLPVSVVPGSSRWGTVTIDGEVYLVAYTSWAAMMRSTEGEFDQFQTMTFSELAGHWPDPRWRLVLDPGLPIAAHLPTNLIRQLAGGEFNPVGGAAGEPEGAADPATEPAEADAAGPTVMQKVIPRAQVPFYLDKGYDWVAGYVHRWQDVAELTTVPDLVENLGLGYPGSPFSAYDDAVFVLRWTAYRAELYRAPLGGTDEESMRSVPGGWVVEHPPFTGTGYVSHSRLAIPEYKINSIRLPHQAEMWRIGADGEHHFVAVYDADDQRWLVNRDLV